MDMFGSVVDRMQMNVYASASDMFMDCFMDMFCSVVDRM
jgi:hypothetical protein